MHDLETLLAIIAKAQDHLRVANTRWANLRHITFDEADILYEIEQARGCLTELTRQISQLHPMAEPPAL
jgi:hypothetical protein